VDPFARGPVGPLTEKAIRRGISCFGYFYLKVPDQSIDGLPYSFTMLVCFLEFVFSDILQVRSDIEAILKLRARSSGVKKKADEFVGRARVESFAYVIHDGYGRSRGLPRKSKILAEFSALSQSVDHAIQLTGLFPTIHFLETLDFHQGLPNRFSTGTRANGSTGQRS
jgi:hypothetical protein